MAQVCAVPLITIANQTQNGTFKNCTMTDERGSFSLTLPTNSYQVVTSADGFESDSRNVKLTADAIVNLSILLKEKVLSKGFMRRQATRNDVYTIKSDSIIGCFDCGGTASAPGFSMDTRKVYVSEASGQSLSIRLSAEVMILPIAN